MLNFNFPLEFKYCKYKILQSPYDLKQEEQTPYCQLLRCYEKCKTIQTRIYNNLKQI